MPYLYGFNINSIQSYIFQTGKLKEIIGASELVEQACKQQFEEVLGKDHFHPDQLLQSAAGRVRYLFEDEALCRKVVKKMPLEMAKRLPGASCSQALVEIKGEFQYCDLWTLEKRLDTQKNKPSAPHNPGWMITDRSPRTGGPLFQVSRSSGEEERLDLGQWTKIKASQQKGSLFSKIIPDASIDEDAFGTEFENLLPGTGDQKKGWLAVVHADGNNLGNLIQQLSLRFNHKHTDRLGEFLRTFSVRLDEATQNAVRQAFEKVVRPVYEQEVKDDGSAYLPLRPIILGGDDLTLIIRGDLALDFTSAYLRNFEDQTKLLFGPLATEFDLEELHNGMTACAGISFVKFNYPFHYAVDLSESLCKYAKATSKKLDQAGVPSCLSFHRVQSSFVGDYQELIDGPLSVPEHQIQFNYGPYFLDEITGYGTIKQLNAWVKYIRRKEAPKGNLREWLTELKINPGSADQLLERIIQLNPEYSQRLGLHDAFPASRKIKNKENIEIEAKFTHIFDLINMGSIHNSES
jgi:hypothetical protein